MKKKSKDSKVNKALFARLHQTLDDVQHLINDKISEAKNKKKIAA